jgi:hypothetical protein
MPWLLELELIQGVSLFNIFVAEDDETCDDYFSAQAPRPSIDHQGTINVVDQPPSFSDWQ